MPFIVFYISYIIIVVEKITSLDCILGLKIYIYIYIYIKDIMKLLY